MAGSNSFSLTPKCWIETTNARGLLIKAGRYGIKKHSKNGFLLRYLTQKSK